MGREFVTKGSRFYCISLQPDICKTPNGASTPAIPYTIKGEFAEATGVSSNITSNQEPVVIHASTVIPTVTGDEAGTAKGVKSQTVGKRVQHDQKSSTVTFNGERAIRVGDTVFMNDKNTIGRVYERSSAAVGSVQRAAGPAQNTTDAEQPMGAFEARCDHIFAPLSDPKTVSHLVFIPPALLNKLPGDTAARAMMQDMARIAESSGREGTSTAQRALRDVPAKVESKSEATDGGSSRGNNMQTVRKGISPSPPLPKVTTAGGEARIVVKELAKLPENVLSALRNGNINVVAVRDTIVEAFPELHNVVPRGWSGTGKTWDDVPGIFMPERGVVAVATSDKFGTGSRNMILHEIGHAYDHAMAALSQSSLFKTAYEADKSHYSAYYLQAGVAGREEAFAESFANYFSKNDSYFADKPHVLQYWKNLPASMQISRGAK